VARFDFYQQADDPTRFTLIEMYRSDEAPSKHRDTPHYARWRDAVADMLAEPRTKVTYNILYPPVIE
jgi:quinol monooxygenase YgiN